jgi:hypothetical protein
MGRKKQAVKQRYTNTELFVKTSLKARRARPRRSSAAWDNTSEDSWNELAHDAPSESIVGAGHGV